MNVQQAAEAANINSFQMYGSFGNHEYKPGELLIHDSVPPWTRARLHKMGYHLRTSDRTSGPMNAVFFDWEHGTFQGASSNYGEDYCIGW